MLLLFVLVGMDFFDFGGQTRQDDAHLIAPKLREVVCNYPITAVYSQKVYPSFRDSLLPTPHLRTSRSPHCRPPPAVLVLTCLAGIFTKHGSLVPYRHGSSSRATTNPATQSYYSLTQICNCSNRARRHHNPATRAQSWCSAWRMVRCCG